MFRDLPIGQTKDVDVLCSEALARSDFSQVHHAITDWSECLFNLLAPLLSTS